MTTTYLKGYIQQFFDSRVIFYYVYIACMYLQEEKIEENKM